jgi:hypothetical protein
MGHFQHILVSKRNFPWRYRWFCHHAVTSVVMS